MTTHKKDDRPDCPACGNPMEETCSQLYRRGQYHKHDCGANFSLKKNGQSFTLAYEGGA